ncbi:Pilus assembly protein, ATPase of CpaF family [Saccharopolyspora antimicrobica]|uniref:Flp pilus assembly CpaF family ATPase n=1 Tax=Saccharopolyspora antimicrobica TaxID=455193 RepID=A0A1I5AYB5_9PSEU|nr:ATPase, T2SS/T4P/T4SS family [Saccharopolyspora antimicrobica]RKT86404.1 Flp pilus assembly CpaF family ATPase [Saccharopolyspora antimicrobica]SFN67351.1 Pilus assembly protein, ATPase of CpaF family [Saccharopolyspora antimicrobica]
MTAQINGTSRPRLVGQAAGWVPDNATVQGLRERVADRLRGTGPDERAGVVAAEISAWAHERASRGDPPLSHEDERRLADAVLAAVFGLGGLQPLLELDDVENIHIHGHDRVWLELADGQLQRWPYPVADSDSELLEQLEAMCARLGQTSREFSPAQPIVNLRLPAGGPLGARLAAVREVTDRPRVAIRRHRLAHTTLADLRRHGTLDAGLEHFLTVAVRAGVNMLVTGGPAAGKTTLLRALCAGIPPGEHIVTVEDDQELGLHLDLERVVTPLEARTANAEGVGEVSMDALLKQALRHSPSRVIVGEVRGGEITALLRALGNGATGGMGTLHALSARAVPDRIAALGQLAVPPLPVEAAHRWTASALDLIVHLVRRDHAGGRERFVGEVVEVGAVGDATIPDLTTLFGPNQEGRVVPVCPPSPQLMTRLQAHGLDRTVFSHPAGQWDVPEHGGETP